MAVCTVGFWITRISDLYTFAINAPYTAANYPADIYPRWLRWLLTGLLPVVTMNYVPLRFALDKGGGPIDLLVPFLTAILALGVGLRLWRFGERRYQSAGN